VEHVDLYPTLMELCGFAVPDGIDGESFLPLLQDPTAVFKPAFSTARPATGLGLTRIARSGGYKLAYWETGEHQLYDLLEDPGEYTNLYGDPLYDDVFAALVQDLYDYGLLEP
jgi:arylsulfatase A-like enzyme